MPLRVLAVILIMSCHQFLGAQEPGEIDSLRKYGAVIWSEAPDFRKLAANEKFCGFLESGLRRRGAMDYSYDSVGKLLVKDSPDGKFRLITWFVPKENQTYEYCGYVVFSDAKAHHKPYIALTDKTGSIPSPSTSILDQNNWYGAIYYDIIPIRYNGKRYYTLLGWKGNNQLTNSKVIDVMTFRSNGNPSFGATIFRKYREKSSRVIFTHSSRAQMSLRYEKQALRTVIKTRKSGSKKPPRNKKRDPNSKAQKGDKVITREKVKKQNMLVFDRLGPIDPRTSQYSANLDGQYQFYVPETNIFDGFILDKGRWFFVKDVDARNPEPKKKKPAKRSPER